MEVKFRMELSVDIHEVVEHIALQIQFMTNCDIRDK